ncbi:porin [Caballeronia udeis]|uniref:Porin n=1 Tax=Caballeronia udeis TaxID=1232866 RepID=A0A158JVD7_9BURK|nr:porin [Caballeronia udeis]
MFGRQAYTGLSSPYGTVTLGRQYDPLVDAVGGMVVSTQWAGNVGSHPGDLDNLNNTNRINNSVKYTSPSFGGVAFSGLYSFGGVAGDTSRSQIWGAGAKYASGALTVGAGYLNARNPNLSFFGSGTSSTPVATTASVSSPIYGGFLSAHTYQAIGAGAQYVIGKATIGATYSNTKFINLGDITSGPNPSRYSGTAAFNNAEVSFSYFVTPALQLGAVYDYTDSGGVGSNDGARYHQGELAAHYFLSRRTDVYLLGVYQHASGTDSSNHSAVAAINTLSPSSSSAQTLIRVGMRTKF